MNLFPPNNPYQQAYQYMANQQHNGIQWVQGLEGAKAFQLSPNSNTVLMDSENEGIFYIKISDAVGMCTLRTFKYTEVTQNSTPVNTEEYVKKSDLKLEVEALVNSMLGGMTNEQSVSTAKPGRKSAVG